MLPISLLNDIVQKELKILDCWIAPHYWGHHPVSPDQPTAILALLKEGEKRDSANGSFIITQKAETLT
jgi:hypothetical protein